MRVDVVRVFTRDGEGGNHLGIVEGHLDPSRMQAVAAEVGYSETIFLEVVGGEMVARIFTPGAELPFAGHPLVGAGWWLREQGHPVERIRTGIGPIGIRSEGDEVVIDVPLDQPVGPGDVPPGVGEAVGVSLVAMPLPYEVVELPTVAALTALEPRDEWQHLYCVARVDDRTVRARFFAADLGVVEDPATGSAAVALAAARRADGHATGRLTILQGEEIGHPSRLELAWDGPRATVGGSVAAEPPLEIDD